MEFFNKKEEVLELQLTEYGKYLLSQGSLDPAYYGFFDEEILYNDFYADGGEDQNSIDQRIRYETPNLKVIANRSGAQTRVDQFLTNATSSNWDEDSDPANKVDNFNMQQPFQNVNNLSSFPLGTSALASQYDAAWSVNVMNRNETTINSTGSQGYIVTNLTASFITGSTDGVITDIPQLEITLDYQTYFTTETDPQSISGPFPPGPGEEPTPATLGLVKNFLILDVLEKNTEFQLENYDVEVYYIHPDNLLTQLNFLNDNPNIIQTPSSLESGDVANVEYYIRLTHDEIIPTEILDSVGLTQESVLRNANRLNIVRDLYTTIEEEPC
tara:strand:+ start:896 stop:1879 length:984 start_codon:yes stop_codon:yes gene_type:complete